VDALDRAILRRLQQDGRQTNRDLAEAVGIAPSTALERTRALRARGVITGVHAAVDPTALGRSVQALVGVRIRPQSRERSSRSGTVSRRCRRPSACSW
jgi:DNA-binding Lrp family transcriptional regulator